MTNLAAAVELVAKWCRESSEWKADKRKQLIPNHFDLGRIKALDKCADELKTILAELGTGAGGEVAATLIHSPDELTRVDISMHGMGLGYGKHDLFTRPPVAGLAELTDERWWDFYILLDNANMKSTVENGDIVKDIAKAAREFLGKVE